MPLHGHWAARLQAEPGAPSVVTADAETLSRAALEGLATAAGEALAGQDLRRRLVLVRETRLEHWLAQVVALWRAQAVVLAVDPTTPTAELARLGESLRAAATLDGDALTLRTGPVHRFRRPLALAKLTSGSTAAPEVFHFTAAQMHADGSAIIGGMGLRADDRHLVAIPPGHSYGWGNLVLPWLLQGAVLVEAPALWPHALAETVERTRCTVFPATPTLIEALLRADVEAAALRSLRCVISAGAPLPPDTALRFRERFGLNIHSFYGSSETGGIAYDAAGGSAATRGNVGRPLPGVSVALRRGQVWVTSPACYTLYNRHSRDSQGTVPLADQAQWTAEGQLVLGGRRRGVLKLGARRLDPREVEAVAQSLPQVEAAHLFLIEATPTRPEHLGLVAAGTVTTEALRAALAEALPPWKRPKRLRVVAALPKTPRGKLDRVTLLKLMSAAP